MDMHDRGRERRIKEHKREKAGRRRRRQKRIFAGELLILSVLLVVAFIQVTPLILHADEKGGGKETSGKKDIKVTEESNSSAVITLEANTAEQIVLGEEYIEPGFSAKDKDGTDLTDQVQVDLSGLNRAGAQQIVYTVEDAKGREARAVRELEVLPNTQYETGGLPICMYHYVYDEASPPENLNANFISTDVLEEEVKYLKENDYYFPSWAEVRDYVDGNLLLPEKSIVLCFDDDPRMIELGVPIFEKYQVPVTCFVITGYWESAEALDAYRSDYVNFETHSHYMHEGGGTIGHGGIYTALSDEEIVSDLWQSIQMCGNGNAFAYPFGDYTEEKIGALKTAGLLCAVTTENGKTYPGMNPYILPRVRMTDGQTLEQFISKL